VILAHVPAALAPRNRFRSDHRAPIPQRFALVEDSPSPSFARPVAPAPGHRKVAAWAPRSRLRARPRRLKTALAADSCPSTARPRPPHGPTQPASSAAPNPLGVRSLPPTRRSTSTFSILKSGNAEAHQCPESPSVALEQASNSGVPLDQRPAGPRAHAARGAPGSPRRRDRLGRLRGGAGALRLSTPALVPLGAVVTERVLDLFDRTRGASRLRAQHLPLAHRGHTPPGELGEGFFVRVQLRETRVPCPRVAIDEGSFQSGINGCPADSRVLAERQPRSPMPRARPWSRSSAGTGSREAETRG